MSQCNCNCDGGVPKTQDPGVVVANAMKKYGYNSIPTGLRQTTESSLTCINNAVVGNKDNTQNCLAKCNEARLNTCLGSEGEVIPAGYCSDACSGTVSKDSTSTNGSVDPLAVFNSCSEGAIEGKCFPSKFSACIREQCGTDSNCISDASNMSYNYCTQVSNREKEEVVKTPVAGDLTQTKFVSTTAGKATISISSIIIVGLILFGIYRYMKRRSRSRSSNFYRYN